MSAPATSSIVQKRCPLGCGNDEDCKRRPRCGDGFDRKLDEVTRR